MLICLRIKLLALTIFLNLAPGVIHKGVDCGHTHKKRAIFTAQRESGVKRKKKTHNKLTWIDQKKKKKRRFKEERTCSRKWCPNGWNTFALKTTESALASEGERKRTQLCLHWPVENTDKYVFAGMVIFLLRTDRQTAPMHTGAIQGNCVKVTSQRKIKPPEPFSALRSRPLHVALFIFFFTFSPSPWISLLSLSLSLHSLSLWISLYQCLSIFKVHFKKLREP